jgi:hypothetical protein
MVKPGSNGKVTAKSVKGVFPLFDLIMKPAYLCQYYDTPLKHIIKNDEKMDLNNESVLLGDSENQAYRLYGVQNESRGVLRKRTREQMGSEVVIKRKMAKYEKKGYYRANHTDEIAQQSAYLFYETGDEQYSYLPINKRVMLVKKKETIHKKNKLYIPGMRDFAEEDDDDADIEYRNRFYRLGEREYTTSELKKKRNNIIKNDAPYDISEITFPQEQLKNRSIVEDYDEPNLDENEAALPHADQDDEDMNIVLFDEDQVSLVLLINHIARRTYTRKSNTSRLSC